MPVTDRSTNIIIMKTLVLTVIGEDRPGIVAELSELVEKHQGNWLESHMANLGGQFAGIVQVEVNAGDAQPLTEALHLLSERGLSVVVAGAGEPAPPMPTRSLEIELLGRDHPGIVHEVTEGLADIGVTIETMSSECFSGSMSGGEMFKAVLGIVVPETLSYTAIEKTLHRISNDMMVDVLIEEPRN